MKPKISQGNFFVYRFWNLLLIGHIMVWIFEKEKTRLIGIYNLFLFSESTQKKAPKDNQPASATVPPPTYNNSYYNSANSSSNSYYNQQYGAQAYGECYSNYYNNYSNYGQWGYGW